MRVERLLLPALIGLLLAGPPVAAREGDRDAPADIEADRAEIDRASGVSRYFGNVVFEQGTLRITGEEVEVRANTGRVQYAQSKGEPATVRQETDRGEQLRANARTIVYEADVPRVTLTGDAELQRGNDRFTAGRIVYWPDTGRVEAGRGEEGDRVRIRIEPATGNGTADGDE